MDAKSARLAARLIAWSRLALGLVALAAPELPARAWIGRKSAATTAGRVLGRALGARDLALAIGAVAALRGHGDSNGGRLGGGDDSGGSSEDPRPWILAGVLADGLDTLVTLGSWKGLPQRGRCKIALLAGGAAVLGLLSAGSL